MYLFQTCQQREKSLKIADRLSRLPSWGFGFEPPKIFFTFLTAQRNSGASGEVNYRYLSSFLVTFSYFITKLVDGKRVVLFLITTQKSFKLIINQLWIWNGNSDENRCIFKLFSLIHFNSILKKSFNFFGEIVFEVDKICYN